MNKRSRDLYAEAVAAYQEYPNIVHGWCGASFPLCFREARLLLEVIEEQEQYCADALVDNRTRMPQSDDALLQYMYDKVVPQIRIAKDVLSELKSELTLHLKDADVVVLEPSRLQLTFLLQTMEWMDICMDSGIVVDLCRYRLSRKFSAVAQWPSVEFAYWLCTVYIDDTFGLTRP